MNFEYSNKSKDLQKKIDEFIKENLLPFEKEFYSFTRSNLWEEFPKMKQWKDKAKAEGLWNLFLPKDYGSFGAGLTNLEYAPLAALMGRVSFASEVFNCSPPDTGNMEVIAKYGNKNQQEKWLKPLLDGSIRSSFLMTEPNVASSDATNIETSIEKDGDYYLINGRKWWSSGAMHPKNEIFIVMGKTDFNAPRHLQQSMVLVPKNTPGVKIIRPLQVYGALDSPEGHAEVELKNVRIPKENILVGEAKGFEIAQGRLGPGRIHHCMRLIGAAERALELMCKRALKRNTFGKTLSKYSSIRQEVAISKCLLEQSKLLTLSAAFKIDNYGIKEAKDLIAMIKIIVPKMTCDIVDKAIQIHGGMGVCQDTPLPDYWRYARTLRLADGPDEVHMYQLGRNIINSYNA
ncbi:MAG: acyl-CoA dehydrogenase family protein [Flavobacteriaceae bacterium]|nr:acyl-CoA dehydrogenase family protein [Flavobacteriaceae bacterium]|tara:strand:+ start:850 stop:2058 length:1209 start_codon:yes stop_codon:yes gene_type:complete